MTSRAEVIGTGLIGSSVALALRAAGWHVTGSDLDAGTAAAAMEIGALDAIGEDPSSTLVFICTPSDSVAAIAEQILAERTDEELIVTDVAGVKASIAEAITDPRFVGGHPMAGSERLGAAGARPDLFLGATWVLTPVAETTPERYGRLLGVVRSLGAAAVALSPSDHDRLVALVSHVPHLVAAALMNEAAAAAEGDAALLQLAAGGFRDMTRIAAGDPSIWPDVLVENSTAVLEGLDQLESQIASLRAAVEGGDRDAIHQLLESASSARRSLPGSATDPDQLAAVRVLVPDQAGVLASVAGAASELGVSVVDVEIAHSAEESGGVMIVIVDRGEVDRFAVALRERGFACSVAQL